MLASRLVLALLVWFGLTAAPAAAQAGQAPASPARQEPASPARQELFVFSPSLERLVGYGIIENGQLRLQVNGYQGPVVALLLRPGAAPTSHKGTLGRGRLALSVRPGGPQVQVAQFLTARGIPQPRVSIAVAGGFEPVAAGSIPAAAPPAIGGAPARLDPAPAQPATAPGKAFVTAPAKAPVTAPAKAKDKEPPAKDKDPPGKPGDPTSSQPGKSKDRDAPGTRTDAPGKTKDAPGRTGTPGKGTDAPDADGKDKQKHPPSKTDDEPDSSKEDGG